MKSKDGLRIFNGATAIITGGGSGIGKALAIELSKNGCEIIIVDIQEDLAGKVVSEIQSLGGKANARKVDVRDFHALKQLVEDTVQRTGRLDFMFNNAGMHVFGDILNNSTEDINLLIDINLKGVINGVQAAYPIMRKQKYGHIINTASYVGIVPALYCAVYAAAKHGIIGLSRSLRAEAAMHNVKINILCPEFINTPLLFGRGLNKNYFTMDGDKSNDMYSKINALDASLFAKEALKQIATDKAIIVIPGALKINILFDKLFPDLYTYMLKRAHRKFHAEYGK